MNDDLYDDMNNNINMVNLDIMNNLQNVQVDFGRRTYRVRNRSDPMVDFNDREFLDRFRMTKRQILLFYDWIDGARNLEPMVNTFFVT